MSRKIAGYVSAVTLTAALAANVWAGQGEGERTRERTGERKWPTAEERFARMDADQSGTISLDEFKTDHAKRTEAMQARMGDKWDAERAAKRPSAEVVFARIDANADGALTGEELVASRTSREQRGKKRRGGDADKTDK